MKAIKYLMMGALMMTISAPVMAQDEAKATITAITNVIKSKAADTEDQVKNVFKQKQQNVFTKYLKIPFTGGGSEQKTAQAASVKIDKKKTYRLTEENAGKTYVIAECCHPIPGDDVLGYVDESQVINRLVERNANLLHHRATKDDHRGRPIDNGIVKATSQIVGRLLPDRFILDFVRLVAIFRLQSGTRN